MENNELSRGTMKSISALLKEMARNQRKKRALRDAFLTEMSDYELEKIFDVWASPRLLI